MRTKSLVVALAAVFLAWTPTAFAQTGCPTSGSGVSCFGGQYFCSASGSCATPATSCPQNQVLSCDACGCTCPAGTTVCSNGVSGNYQKCIANRTCPNGMTWDVCTDTCVTPYVLLSPGAVQSGTPSLNGSLTLTGTLNLGGDVVMPTGKAVRVDAAGATALNLGNWGTGATGFTMNVFGNLAATSTSTNNFCLSGTCRTTWPASGDYSSTFVDANGDTMGGLLTLNGVPTSLVTTGNVGIGTASPAAMLHVLSPSGQAILGISNGTGIGVQGQSATGYGVYGMSSGNSVGAVVGTNTNATLGYGVLGQGVIGTYGMSAAAAGYGAVGYNTATTGNGIGLYGVTSSANGYGLYSVGRGYFSNSVGIGVTNPTQALDVAGTVKATGFQLPTGATAGYALVADASGNGTWQAVSNVSATGTANYVTKFTGANTLGNSSIFDNGKVGIGTAAPGALLSVGGATGNLKVTANGALTTTVAATDRAAIDSTVTTPGAGINFGVKATANSATTINYGVYSTGTGSGGFAYGVAGYASGGSTNHALWGQASGPAASNNGVIAQASGATTNTGVSATASGVATTNYGVYADAYGATTNYGVYSNRGLNYFYDNMGIGISPVITTRLYVQKDSSSGDAYGANVGATQTGTAASTAVGGNFAATQTGAITSGTDATYGVFGSATNTAAHGGGVIDTYGGRFVANGNANAASTAYGVYAEATGADENFGVFALGDKNYFSGDVGIGVANPTQALDVAGNVKTDSAFCIGGSCISAWPAPGIGGSGTSSYVPKFTGAMTVGNSQIVDNGTSVGIGTASPSNGKLDVQVFGGTAVYGNANGGSGVVGYGSTGVYGNGTSYGMYGNGSFAGVSGNGNTYGVMGSGNTYGVYGNTSTVGASGVFGMSSASSGSGHGVYGVSQAPTGAGVYGDNVYGYGLRGTGYYGVYAEGSFGNYIGYRFTNNGVTTPALVINNPSGGSQTVVSLRNNNVANANLRADSSGNMVLSATGTLYLAYPDLGVTSPINFMNGGMNLNSTGLGIGTNPTYKLDVAGGIRSQDYSVAGGVNIMVGDDAFFSDIDAYAIIGLNGVGDNNVGGVRLGNGGPTLFGNGGTLGVGTTSPVTNARIATYGGGIAINQASGSADAALQINGASGCCGRLTQMYGVGANQNALNIIASTNGGGGAQWWAWGVDYANVYRISVGTNLVGNGLAIDASSNLYAYGGMYTGASRGGQPYNYVCTSGVGAGYFGNCTSLRENKTNVRPMVVDLERWLKAEPVYFNWKDKKWTQQTQIGFIAEDIEKVLPEVAQYDEKGKLTGVNYPQMTAYLFAMDKDIYVKLASLEKRLAALDGQVVKLDENGKATITTLEVKGKATVGGDLKGNGDANFPNNDWGKGSGWISCPETGECLCPTGLYVTKTKDRGAQIYCSGL